MGVSENVQRKVIEVTSSKLIDDSTKLMLKKDFYNLKYKEVELGEIELAFQKKVDEYEAVLDSLKAGMKKPVNAPIESIEEENLEKTIQANGRRVMIQPTIEEEPETIVEGEYEVQETQ